MAARYASKRTLQLVLSGLLVALLVPSVLLAVQVYEQLKRETLLQHRVQAEELTRRIDARLAALIEGEDAVSFAAYNFLVVAGKDFVQRSPLSGYPVSGDLPGLVSYFQIDAEGRFTTPLVPERSSDAARYGIEPDEYQSRVSLQRTVRSLLLGASLDAGEQAELEAPATAAEARLRKAEAAAESLEPALESASATSAFAPAASSPSAPTTAGALSAGTAPTDAAAGYRAGAKESDQDLLATKVVLERLNELDGVSRYQRRDYAVVAEPDAALADSRASDAVAREAEQTPSPQPAAGPATQAPDQVAAAPRQAKERAPRRELNVAPEAAGRLEGDDERVQLTTFVSEVEPFRFAVLDRAHFLLYRSVWREGTRYVQGAALERGPFLDDIVGAAFAGTALSQVSGLTVTFGGVPVARWAASDASRAQAPDGRAAMYRATLSPPFNAMEVMFTLTSLEVGVGRRLILWTAAALIAVILGGVGLVYRLGLRQLQLNRQQQDFVSAVSHELKTPLTSIRMYGEILKAGWADEDKKKTYYDFIYAEAERLSRLISNVLQLARLTRNDAALTLQPVSVGELMDLVRSKIASQIEQAGFELDERHEAQALVLAVDTDAFCQVMINLVDNALKFSADADVRRIVVTSRPLRGQRLELTVRDFGPGIGRDQMRKIFGLFYRSEGELTRRTTGTGIGLALVQELVGAMGGTVTVQNRNPGAEFRLVFPATG